DMGYARVPNGSGPFVEQTPTFAATNDLFSTVHGTAAGVAFEAFPNPTAGALTVRCAAPTDLELLDATGRLLWSGRVIGTADLDLSLRENGQHLLRSSTGAVLRVMVLR
ncbi:MAG TPA: hypothetical protein PLH93_11430, partial [Flavobacteriales bacterium]|nr:hypothetical protein [Flavobacteriales bacterium]